MEATLTFFIALGIGLVLWVGGFTYFLLKAFK
jgi:hypothetical protein